MNEDEVGHKVFKAVKILTDKFDVENWNTDEVLTLGSTLIIIAKQFKEKHGQDFRRGA